MGQSWYQLRIPTFVHAMILLCGFVAQNSRDHDDGIVRIYLNESETMSVAYRAWIRGWPQTYAVKYALDEEHTTMLGFPKRKYIEDKFFGKSLFINVFAGFAAMAIGMLFTESSLRLFSLLMRPASAALEAPLTVEATPASAVAKEDASPTESAAAADAPAPRGRPISSRRPISVQKRKPRPVSVNPAIAPQRIAALKRAAVKKP